MFFQEIEGFFNLVYSHLFTLFAVDAPETKKILTGLLQTIATSSDHVSIQYRLYVECFPFECQFTGVRLYLDFQTSLTPFHGTRPCVYQYTKRFCKS